MKDARRYVIALVLAVGVLIILFSVFRTPEKSDVVSSSGGASKNASPDADTSAGNAAGESAPFTDAEEQTLTNTLTEGMNVASMNEAEKLEAIVDSLEDFPAYEMPADQQTAEEAMVADMMQNGSAAASEIVGVFEERVHPTFGKVRILAEGGIKKLVFEDDFQSEPGPQLHVFLSGTASPKNSADLHAVGEVDLGRLKSTDGAQVYELPGDTDFDIKSVVIYCVPFKVVFGFADLK